MVTTEGAGVDGVVAVAFLAAREADWLVSDADPGVVVVVVVAAVVFAVGVKVVVFTQFSPDTPITSLS